MNKKPKVVAIIQARMGSTRLPGKVMKKILGRTVLELVVERVKKAAKIDEIVIATTTGKNDDKIEDLCRKLNLNVFRGSEEDVLRRYYESAKEYKADVIVRITSDCPLIDPDIIDKIIDFYFEKQPLDYVSNGLERTFPRGLDVEVFSFGALELANESAKKNREHVTPYMYKDDKNMKTANFANKTDLSEYRLTVDYEEDFLLINEIYKELGKSDRVFGLDKIIELLKKRPDLVEINKGKEQKGIEE